MLKDPVCGQRINRNQAYARVTHEHVTYYLCCPLCQAEFAAAPERYADPQVGEAAHGSREGRHHRHQAEAVIESDRGEPVAGDHKARPRRRPQT